MAEATTTGANPAATSAGTVTMDQVNTAIAAALKPVTEAITPLGQTLKDLAANQKVLADTFAADKARADAAAAAAAGAAGGAAGGNKDAKPLTKEDVAAMVGQSLKDALAQQAQAQQSSAQRNAFIQEKLANVPSAFASQLGTDPAKWPEEEAKIRADAAAEAKRLGWKVPDVSGGNPGGATTAGASNDQQITQLKAAGLSDGEAAFAATLQVPGKAT